MKTCPCVHLWMSVSLGSRCNFLFGFWKLWSERLSNIKLTQWEKRKDTSFLHSIFVLTSKFFPNSLQGRYCKRLRVIEAVNIREGRWLVAASISEFSGLIRVSKAFTLNWPPGQMGPCFVFIVGINWADFYTCSFSQDARFCFSYSAPSGFSGNSFKIDWVYTVHAACLFTCTCLRLHHPLSLTTLQILTFKDICAVKILMIFRNIHN